MRKIISMLLAAWTVTVLAVEFDSPARISGVTDKDPLTYAPGEKMTFTLKLADLGQAIPENSRIWWKRTGDDGQVLTGSLPSTPPPGEVRAFRESPRKLREFVDAMNARKVDFVVELGDFAVYAYGRVMVTGFRKARSVCW